MQNDGLRRNGVKAEEGVGGRLRRDRDREGMTEEEIKHVIICMGRRGIEKK